MVKVPALFLLTLLVTLPSLYVFNALVGSRLRGPAIVGLLVASLAVTLTVLASFGPIVAFFSVTTTNYSFMVLLNVAIFALAGFFGLSFLLRATQCLTLHAEQSPTETIGRNVKAVFVCWVIVYGLVGAQMSWVLRPFIGSPNQPFEWFRHRESNFFEAVGRTLLDLLF
jgi:hypothetical protein